eukprot:TRINITY_DN2899_c0_g1_i4.p1 TRINITY_DN2899_c0_g1~~TRINITY_DN2899_c0_g1_i4.p1  ORF type:complete len:276 (-),score=59.96 TRINITY_DN2899_c0_g1_i4:137-964(-)
MQYGGSAVPSFTRASKTDFHVNDALRMQYEVQRRLREQVQVQQHLRLRLEAQGKYLQSILEKARETLAGHNMSCVGVEAARAELTQLASKVSNDCLSPNAFTTFAEIPPLYQQNHPQQMLNIVPQIPDCSLQSSLTSNESSEKLLEQSKKRLRPFENTGMPLWQMEIRDNPALRDLGLSWEESIKESDGILAEAKDSDQNSVLKHESLQEGSVNYESDYMLQPWKRVRETKGDESPSMSFKLSKLTEELDLNATSDVGIASDCRGFDLNGFGRAR